MNREISRSVDNSGAWIWLPLSIGAATLLVASAVSTREIGHAISGLGVVLLGVFAYLYPISFRADVRFLRRPEGASDRRVITLGAIGALLNAVGVVVRWVG